MGAYSDEAISDPSLVAYWRLGESSPSGDDSVLDSSGNGHHGTPFNSPTFGVGGVLGGDEDTAATFGAASNEYVLTDTIGNFGESIGNCTVEFWVKTTQLTLGTVFGTLNDLDGTFFSVDINYNNVITTTGYMRLALRNGASLFHSVSTDANIYDGNWHHVVWSKSGPKASDAMCCIDGVSVDTNIESDSGDWVSGGSSFEYALPIGAFNFYGGISRFLDGSLDELALYSEAKDAAWALSRYEAGLRNIRAIAQYHLEAMR